MWGLSTLLEEILKQIHTHTYPYAHFLIVSKRNTGRKNQWEKHWKEEGENEKQKEEWK